MCVGVRCVCGCAMCVGMRCFCVCARVREGAQGRSEEEKEEVESRLSVQNKNPPQELWA